MYLLSCPEHLGSCRGACVPSQETAGTVCPGHPAWPGADYLPPPLKQTGAKAFLPQACPIMGSFLNLFLIPLCLFNVFFSVQLKNTSDKAPQQSAYGSGMSSSHGKGLCQKEVRPPWKGSENHFSSSFESNCHLDPLPDPPYPVGHEV